LAALGRYLYDNDGLVGYAVDQIANYSVPILPQAASPNPEWNKKADGWFAEWCKRADFTGRFTFDTMQRLICKAIDTDGDIAPLMTLANGFPQLQLVESHRINSRKISDPVVQHADGVRIDRNGVVLGYYLDNGGDKPVPVSAAEMVLLYDPDRYSSYRGISALRRGMNDVRDAKDIKGFEKLATKISSALAAVLEGDGVVEEDVWGNDTGNQDGTLPGNAVADDAEPKPTQQEKKLSIAELLGGDILNLPEGKKLKQLDNNRPGERVLEMLGYLGGCFVAGLGVPPAFFIDEKLTGPNQRSVNGKAQRKFEQRQALLAAFVEWVWVRVIAWAIDHGELEGVEGFTRMEWQGPPKVSIDEGKDSAQWREDVARGLMTRQNHFANRALNWQRETDQSFAEDDYIFTKARELSQAHGVPVEVILARYGYAPTKGAVPEEGGAPQEKSKTE
jgi:capsid protein